MTLDEIVDELNQLKIDFVLVSRDRSARAGEERLDLASDEFGISAHPAHCAWLLFQGIQQFLGLQGQVDPTNAARQSAAIQMVAERCINSMCDADVVE